MSITRSEKMSNILKETVNCAEIRKLEKIYFEKLYKNTMKPKDQLDYGWALMRSKYINDIQKGIILIEELYKTDVENKREYLYFLAVGNAKLKNYCTAVTYLNTYLAMKPECAKVQKLMEAIKREIKLDELKSWFMAVGVAITVTALVGLGMNLASRIRF